MYAFINDIIITGKYTSLNVEKMGHGREITAYQ
jgi:hypothetical protein